MRCLKSDELELWLQFLADAFSDKHPNMLELFRMQVNEDKHFHVEDVLLLGQYFTTVQEQNLRTCYVHVHIVNDSTWLSTFHVTRKEMWLDGSRVKMAGIANVATGPAHVKQGYGLKMMSYAPKHAVQVQEAWLAGLHCSRSELWPFYEKCGFVHVPLQEDHVTMTFLPLKPKPRYKIQQCGFTETELHQMTTLHVNYFSGFTGPLCRSEDYCSWNTANCIRGGVTFGCLYEASQENTSKMIAYIGIRKIASQDGDKIEIEEYAGSHDPDIFMSLLCNMIQKACQYQPEDQVSIVYQSLMCNKAWFAAMTTTQFETKLQYGFMY